MANLKDIRNRIKSVKSIQQVTKAMKMVAAAKMRRAQENMEQARPYTFKMENMLNNLISEVNSDLLPVLETRSTIKKKLFVIVTADRGMAGAFNTNITKTAHKAIDDFGKDVTKIATARASVVVNNEQPATGGGNAESLDEIKQNALANFAALFTVHLKKDSSFNFS